MAMVAADPKVPADEKAQAQEGNLVEVLALPEASFALPESVYSAAAFMPIICKDGTWNTWFDMAFGQYVSLVLNVIVQGAFITFVKDIYDSSVQDLLDGAACETLDHYTFGFCGWTFVSYICMDIKQTMSMLEVWLRMIPTASDGHTKQLMFSRDGPAFVSGDISLARKTLVLLIVFVPKLLLALSLGLIGTRYLAISADDTELILNCVALVFVIDLDELIFQFFSSPKARLVMQSIPPFERRVKDHFPWNMWTLIAPFVKFIFSVGVTFCIFFTTPTCGYIDGIGHGRKDPM